MRDYVFRKYLRRSIYTFTVCSMYFISLFIMYGVISFMTLDKINKFEFNKIYWPFLERSIGILCIAFIFIYFIYLRKLKDIRIMLHDDRIIYVRKKIERTIYYNDIQEVDFAPIKYTRGWIKIKDKNSTIKLTIDIENIAGFLKDFKEKLDNAGLSDKYNSNKMYDFYKTASYSDDSWERIYELLKFVPPVTAFDMVLGFIFSFFVTDIYIRLVIIILLFLFPLLVLIFTEIILAVKHLIEMKNEQYIIRMRDYQYEHRVFDAVTVILAIMIGTILIYLTMKY